MAQIRYRDWKSPITSKGSVEPQALAVGIGPQFGFDDIDVTEVSPDTYDIVIGAKNLITPGDSDIGREVLITDRENMVKKYHGGVVTPDGILTVIDEPLVFLGQVNSNVHNVIGGGENFEIVPPLNNTSQFVEFILKASHIYLEDDDIQSPTVFSLVANTHFNSSYIWDIYHKNKAQELSLPPKTMNNWFGIDLGGSGQYIDHSTEVIIGLIIYDRVTGAKFSVCPYRYQWPQPKVIPETLWKRQGVKLEEDFQEIHNILSPLKLGAETQFNSIYKKLVVSNSPTIIVSGTLVTNMVGFTIGILANSRVGVQVGPGRRMVISGSIPIQTSSNSSTPYIYDIKFNFLNMVPTEMFKDYFLNSLFSDPDDTFDCVETLLATMFDPVDGIVRSGQNIGLLELRNTVHTITSYKYVSKTSTVQLRAIEDSSTGEIGLRLNIPPHDYDMYKVVFKVDFNF